MSRLNFIRHKIVSLDEAKRRVAQWRINNLKVGFTNGCFDILHQGHVTYLAQSADYADRLIVGINSDDSVRRQGKGDNRPVNGIDSRALVLASLEVVDLVVEFDEDTPINLIETLLPDVLLKGADYDPNETDPKSKKFIVGSDVVRNNGGAVVAVPLVEGFSTTAIIDKLS